MTHSSGDGNAGYYTELFDLETMEVGQTTTVTYWSVCSLNGYYLGKNWSINYYHFIAPVNGVLTIINANGTPQDVTIPANTNVNISSYIDKSYTTSLLLFMPS